MHQKKQLIIIGSGPAGYTAALYASRANMKPLLLEGFFSGLAGGQLMSTTEVENYPGFPLGITGPDLMKNFREQAQRFGTEVLTEDAEWVDLSKRPFKVKAKNHIYETEALIIATGATANRLEIPGAGEGPGEFWQRGVTACAVCDGAAPIFRNKPLFVIGGGDSAIEEGTFLTKFASKVYIVHRRDQLRASKIMQQRAFNNPKVEVLWDSVIVSIQGDDVVRKVVIENVKNQEKKDWEAGGVFFAIGHTPNTAFLKGQLELETNGYVKVKPGTSLTSIEGVFAAGDVQDHVYRQAITAAGSGCMAALDAERWLSGQGIHG